MGSRDRPGKEAKKKPKAKLGQPKLSPLSEPPQNVEVIRKPRKEKPRRRGRRRTRADRPDRSPSRPAPATGRTDR